MLNTPENDSYSIEYKCPSGSICAWLALFHRMSKLNIDDRWIPPKPPTCTADRYNNAATPGCRAVVIATVYNEQE